MAEKSSKTYKVRFTPYTIPAVKHKLIKQEWIKPEQIKLEPNEPEPISIDVNSEPFSPKREQIKSELDEPELEQVKPKRIRITPEPETIVLKPKLVKPKLVKPKHTKHEQHTHGILKARPILFPYHSETTGPDSSNDQIVNIAVTTLDEEPESFSSLIKPTHQKIGMLDSSFHGITNDDVKDKPEFKEAIQHLCDWIKIKCAEITNKTSVPHYPILVAHAGCRFFYKFLVSEVKRAKMDPSCFDNIKFCDNLQHLQQARKLKDSEAGAILGGVKKLGLHKLYHHFFPDDTKNTGHPSSVAVQNMRQLLRQPLKHLLPFTKEYSYDDLEEKWQNLCDEKDLRDQFDISSDQARRLVTLRLSTERLQELYNTSPDFDEELHRMRVNSKPLREKLLEVLKWT